MTCREEILDAIHSLQTLHPGETFSVDDVLDVMHQRNTKYLDTTIRAQVVTKMCRNAAPGMGTRYPDLERVAPNRYRMAKTV